MRIGTPSSSKNCLERRGVCPACAAPMRVPSPAAGIMTKTFIRASQYNEQFVETANGVVQERSRMESANRGSRFPRSCDVRAGLARTFFLRSSSAGRGSLLIRRGGLRIALAQVRRTRLGFGHPCQPAFIELAEDHLACRGLQHAG